MSINMMYYHPLGSKFDVRCSHHDVQSHSKFKIGIYPTQYN
jgi:hypothetical protein